MMAWTSPKYPKQWPLGPYKLGMKATILGTLEVQAVPEN